MKVSNDNLNEPSNVREIPLKPDPQAAAEEQFEKVAGPLARMRKRMYDEYVAAGFSPAQALELCAK